MRISLIATIALATIASALPKHCPLKHTCNGGDEAANSLGKFYATDATDTPKRVGTIQQNGKKGALTGVNYCTNMDPGTTANAMRATVNIRCVFYYEPDCPDGQDIGNTKGLQGQYAYPGSGAWTPINEWPVQKLDGQAKSAHCFGANLSG